MFKNMEQWLRENGKKDINFTEESSNLIDLAQGMLSRERKVILEETGELIPQVLILNINDNDVNALSTKIDNENCIFVNKGVISSQRTYLYELDYSFLEENTNQKDEYITCLVKYGWLFTVFHEYAHIYCGHTDAGLTDLEDKRAQECEADMVAFDYLIKWVLYNNNMKDYVNEMVKLFVAVYFLFSNMHKEGEPDWYNDKKIFNYYDEDSIKKRNHPLSGQRIMYLFDMLNVTVLEDSLELEVLPIQEKVLENLAQMKKIKVKDNKYNLDYINAKDSVEKLKKTVVALREKIPRRGNSKK